MKLSSVAVTGGNGMLGREVTRELSRHADVISLDITPSWSGTQFRYVDVLSFESVRNALRGYDAVVHLAALQLFPRQERIFEVNVVGTWNVLQAAREVGIHKVVLVSSKAATGIINLSDSPRAMPDYLPIDEAHPLRPVDAYGVSKQVTEANGHAFARRGDMQVVVLRATTVYVPGMEPEMREARGKDDPYLWLYVEGFDVARAVRLGLEYDGLPYDCFFVSARNTFATEETLAFVERKFGRRPEVRDTDLYARDPHATIYDLFRAETVLGFEAKSDWRRFLGEQKVQVS